jgi:hypothetical protein
MGLGFLAFTPYISIYIDDGKGELFHFGGIPLFILIANWNCNGERKRETGDERDREYPCRGRKNVTGGSRWLTRDLRSERISINLGWANENNHLANPLTARYHLQKS